MNATEAKPVEEILESLADVSSVYVVGCTGCPVGCDVGGQTWVDEITAALRGAGKTVTKFSSFHNGLGRFEITANAADPYFMVITKPVGITQKIPLPAIADNGCSIQAVDDPNDERDDVRVGIWCSVAQSVVATAVLRERRLGDLAVNVEVGEPTVVSLPVPVGSQGAVRFTLFSDELTPMAERLIYRGRGNDLKV